jgi:hypothetical protein
VRRSRERSGSNADRIDRPACLLERFLGDDDFCNKLRRYAIILVSMKQQDLQQLAQYSDQYIAFVGDILHVIASGTSLTELHTQLKKKNITKATITYIPPVDKVFTPLCQ